MSQDGVIDRDLTANKIVELIELMLKKEDPAAMRHMAGQVAGIKAALTCAGLEYRIAVEIAPRRASEPPKVLTERRGALY